MRGLLARSVSNHQTPIGEHGFFTDERGDLHTSRKSNTSKFIHIGEAQIKTSRVGFIPHGSA